MCHSYLLKVLLISKFPHQRPLSEHVRSEFCFFEYNRYGMEEVIHLNHVSFGGNFQIVVPLVQKLMLR